MTFRELTAVFESCPLFLRTENVLEMLETRAEAAHDARKEHKTEMRVNFVYIYIIIAIFLVLLPSPRLN